MARRSSVETERLLPFARWLLGHMEARGASYQQVADAADMDVSQLHKIVKSYMPTYAQYQRPGYEKTLAIGTYLGDARGALEAAGFSPPAALPAAVESRRAEDDPLTLEREYRTPTGEPFKIYGTGDAPPDVLEKIAGDVDRRMREWDTEERLKRYEAAENGEETPRS